jgi:hypothetical protein
MVEQGVENVFTFSQGLDRKCGLRSTRTVSERDGQILQDMLEC